jgi:hypothetical protein
MCTSVSAHMAAILMTRSVIEAVAKDNGIDCGGLFKKIDAIRARV